MNTISIGNAEYQISRVFRETGSVSDLIGQALKAKVLESISTSRSIAFPAAGNYNVDTALEGHSVEGGSRNVT